MNRRPLGVTIVGVLILIFGILGLIGGIAALIALFVGSRPADGDQSWLANLVAVIFTMLISVIYLAVARGILIGQNGARVIVGIVTVIGLIGSIIGLFTVGFGVIVPMVIQVVILVILFGSSGSAYFRRSVY